MCILTMAVRSVASTRIMVNDLGHGVRATIYQMALAADTPVAMVLPVPTGGDIAFEDLSGYPEIFRDIDSLFPAAATSRGMRSLTKGIAKSTLPVENVGDYEATFVPSVDDFDRLDACFRLPKRIWEKLPYAEGYGFAVFQFRDVSKSPATSHPMAYRYVTNQPDVLWFPTTHVHDGHSVPRSAAFDHHLYYTESWKFYGQWDISIRHPAHLNRLRAAAGRVLPHEMSGHVCRKTMIGSYANKDVVVSVGKNGYDEK